MHILPPHLRLGSLARRSRLAPSGLLAGTVVCCLIGVGITAVSARPSWAADRPHVVIIMADDLGYGDVQPLNAESQIPTPTFNRLAAEGITFTDAHTPSAVCTPTRYGLVTGRYCWRTRLKRGVLNGYGKPLIGEDRPTLASAFGSAGYHTAVVGKWHLGLGLRGDPPDSIDLSKRLSHHPGTVGFRHSFIIPASLDFPPYVYFENGRATTAETVPHAATSFPAFTRRGPKAADFDMQGCLDRLADEAVAVVSGMSERDEPTLLYFPLTAPHKPVLPAERFDGATELGPYGDFVHQVDATIGRIVDAIEAEGVLDETLLIVTSDNGSFMYELGEDREDHVEDETVQGYRPGHHRSNGRWRGTKADIWEGGHRVPFFVRLPEGEHAGSRVDSVVGLVDVMATVAEMTGTELSNGAGPDSVSFGPLLRDPKTEFERAPLICHSAAGMFGIRDGKWKLVAGNGSGGRERPRGTPFADPWKLFDLDRDPAETTNVAEQHPDVFTRLAEELEAIREAPYRR